MSLTKVTYSMIDGAIVNVLDYGAVGDGVADDTAAIAAALTTGSMIFFPRGTYLVSSALQLGFAVGGSSNSITLKGEGRDLTIIKSTSSDVFSIADAAYLSMSDMTVYSDVGGGHCFVTTVDSAMMTFRNMVLRNDNAAKSLWHQPLGYCGLITFEQCRFQPNSTSNLTAHPFNVESNQIINGWHIKDCRTEKTLGTLQFFNINTSNASSFNTNCKFENITFQEPYGGWFKLGGCRAVTIENCASYDMSAAQTGHGILIGASTGGQISSRVTIRHCGRYVTTGGTLSSGIKDILLTSGQAANCIIEACFNNAAGATFTVDYGNNKTLHIDRPSNSESSYSNDANVLYIDINGDRVGVQSPAYRTTQGTASRVLTISSGSITPDLNYHQVDTEGGAASDDLDTIVGTYFFAGDELTLIAANSARTVVLKDGTGNLELAGDFSLDDTGDTIKLLFNGSSWQELSRSNNS